MVTTGAWTLLLNYAIKNKEMKKRTLLLVLPCLLLLGSCYKGYEGDFDYSSVGFAITNPLRTVIAGRNMEIRLGVSVGGKREVDMNDWATFEIDPSLLEGTTFKLLPAAYYRLSSENRFTVQKANLPVADVGVTFTPAFFEDEKAVGNYYALPLRITGSSVDTVIEGRNTCIAVIRCISNYHGTYYIKGRLLELSDGAVVNTTVYNDKDLVKNITRDLKTVSQYSLERPGLANFPVAGNEKIKLTVVPGTGSTNTVTVESAQGGIAITEGEGRYEVGSSDPRFILKYSFVKGGKNYRAEDTLLLRQDPLKDLRVETW